jgi:hypothetical protein
MTSSTPQNNSSDIVSLGDIMVAHVVKSQNNNKIAR